MNKIVLVPSTVAPLPYLSLFLRRTHTPEQSLVRPPHNPDRQGSAVVAPYLKLLENVLPNLC